jgi:hypothetical protein
MRKKSTRLLSAALAVCMMLSALPVGAFAAEPGAEEQENGASAQADAAVPEGYIAINEKNFPDENFRDYVAEEWDKNHDKYFSPSEIANAKWISCDNKEISNLKGIEFFTNIWLLECYYNNLTTIDLSHNKNLSYINCHHNQLNELDVSGLPLLETFYCGHNALPSIDVSKNEKLEDFDCQDNHLDTLDVSQNKELVKLSCGTNNLTELDVRENKKLKELSCYESKLSNLDLRNQTELEVLKCWKNPLSVLDVSANTKLKTLFVSNTNLTSLDAKNHTALATFGGKNCSYNIAVEGDGKFDLTTLPGKFDASKATATGNGTINGNILTVNPNSKTFYYDYDIGQNQKMNVVLNVHWHNYQWKHDGTKHWRECTTANCPGLTAEQVAKTTHDYTDATDPDCNTCGYVRPLYTVTTGENVTAKLEDEVLDAPVAADTKVHLTAIAPEGQHFIGWTVKVGDEEQKADTFLTPDKNDPTKATFTMPSKNVEVTANFASNPTLNPTLRVGDHVTATIEGSDASVPSGSTVPVGETVHLTATAPEGQHFISWTVLVGGEEQKADTFLTTPDENDPTKVTFTMPDANVEVTATFADDPIGPDGPDPVGPSDTGNIQGAISAVVVGAAAGVIAYEAGTGIYRVINMPGIPMPSNRIELAELLWEHAGKPEPVSTALYSDIDEGDTDAQKAARWAVEQDLMKDDADNNKFHPAFPVSKLRTCLTWNAAKEKGLFDKTEE